MPQQYNILFLCAESSGDLLTSELITELENYGSANNINFQFSGIFGTNSEAQGLKSLIPLADIAVMGIFEIFSALGRIRHANKLVLDHVKQHKIDMVICVDGFAFSHPLAKKIQKQNPNAKIIRYVAPKLWAWGQWRVKNLKGVYDLILSNLPFEPDFFREHGIKTHFVGHSVTQRIQKPSPDQKDNSILLLAGSRRSEISKLMPIFYDALEAYPNKHFIMPIADGQEKWFLENYADKLSHYQNLRLLQGTQNRFDAFTHASCAIAASGTVSLELMMADVPSIIIYKFSYLTEKIAKILVKVKYATLLNILLDKMSFPEFIGENCHFDLINPYFSKLLKKDSLYEEMKRDFSLGRKFFRVFNEAGEEITPTQKAVHYLAPYFNREEALEEIEPTEKQAFEVKKKARFKIPRTRKVIFKKTRLRKRK